MKSGVEHTIAVNRFIQAAKSDQVSMPTNLNELLGAKILIVTKNEEDRIHTSFATIIGGSCSHKKNGDIERLFFTLCTDEFYSGGAGRLSLDAKGCWSFWGNVDLEILAIDIFP